MVLDRDLAGDETKALETLSKRGILIAITIGH